MGKEKRLLLLAVMILGIQTGSYGTIWTGNTDKQITQKDIDTHIELKESTSQVIAIQKGGTANIDSGVNVNLIKEKDDKKHLYSKFINVSSESKDKISINNGDITINNKSGKNFEVVSMQSGTFQNDGTISISGKGGIGFNITGAAKGANNGTFNIENESKGVAISHADAEFINGINGEINVTGGTGFDVKNGKVNNFGTINIKNVKGFYITGGEVTNSGTISILSGTGFDIRGGNLTNTNEINISNGKGIYVEGGVVTNEGTVSVSNGVGFDIKEGNILNNKKINITNGKGFNSKGGLITNAGTISISSGTGFDIRGGNLTNTNEINISNGKGIYLDGGEVTNSGTISISGGTGFDIRKGKLDTSGIINISGGKGIIQAAGTVNNTGKMNISKGVTGLNLQSGTFTNNINGQIKVTEVNSKGIQIATDGKVENAGTIDVSESSTGIYLTSGTFNNHIELAQKNNQQQGLIRVSGKNSKGIQIDGGIANNTGAIAVESAGMGVYFGNAGAFNNNCNIIVSGKMDEEINGKIVTTGSKGIYLNSGGIVNNTGNIYVGYKLNEQGNIVTGDGGSIGIQLNNDNAEFTNKAGIEIVGENSKGVQLNKGTGTNAGTITAVGKNAVGIYLNKASDAKKAEFTNGNKIIASGEGAKGIQFGAGGGTITNNKIIEARNGALGVFFYQGTNNNLINSGTIDAGVDGTAIESGKDTNNTITLQNGSKVTGAVKGNSGIDVLALEEGTYSNLNVSDYEKIIAKSGDSTIKDSTISLGFNENTDKHISENVGNAEGNVKITDSKLVIDLSNKKEESTGLVSGKEATLDGNMKLAFIADNQRKFNISEILNENLKVGDNISLGDSAVWNYSKDEKGNLIAEKKTYNNAIGKSELSDFAKVLDENEKTASGDFKKGMAVLSMLNEPEFTDAMTQMSGGIHGYTADFAAINSRTLSEVVKSRILREDKTRNKAVSSYEQDVIHINKNHKIGGLMDVDYNEKGILAVTEKQLLSNGKVGLVYGGSKGKVDFENGKHGKANMDNIYLGGYYDHEFSDKVSLLSNINFVYSHTDVTRNVNLSKYDISLKDHSYKSTYPVFGFGMGTKVLYTLFSSDNNKVTAYGGIDWTKIVQGNINENSSKAEDKAGENLTIKNIPADEQMYDSVVPNIGLAVQNNGYIFDRKYRIGADISYETELGNIKDEKKLKLSALNDHHRITTTERENIISYSLNGALDLTDNFTIYADYTKTSSDDYDADRVGAGFEYRMNRMSDIFVTGPMLSDIENNRFYSKRWSGVWSVMLDAEDDTDRSYYTDVSKEHSRGDYATSLKLKPKMTLSLNDRDTKWSYYFETYYMKNGMGMNLDENERRKSESRLHAEARWTDQYSKGKYGINFGYRNETSSTPTLSQYEEYTGDNRIKRGTHQLRITPNITYNLGNGFVFGGSTTLIGAYDYRGYRDGQTDLEMENEWGITYNGFMPKWRFTVNYFREETWYDRDFTKTGRVAIEKDGKKEYIFTDVEGENRYQSNQLRPTITYFFGNGARLVLNARIPIGNGAWHNSDDGNKKSAEKYETRYGVKYYQPITPGFTGFIGGEILTTKTKNTDHSSVNYGKETRDYSIRPTVGFSYSF